MRSIKSVISLLVLSMSLSACYLKHAQPYYAYAPDMHFSPGLKAQKEGAMRQPVKGTIPRGFRPYSIVTMEEAKAHLNPFPKSKEVLVHGKQLFNVYCIVCHGQYGEGDGLVVAKANWPRPLFARPPSLQSDKIRDYKDGQIFHVITMGQNLMPSYAEKLDNDERWAIVHYLRALYRAKHPTDADMKASADFVEENN
jgi:mono/diheme cytochrome c family protein